MKNNLNATMNLNLRVKPVLAGALFTVCCYPAYAASDFSFTGGLGLEAHDNAGLTHDNEESDISRIVNADVGYKNTDGVVLANINYRASYADYVHDTQGNETTIDGSTDLTWQIAPRRLEAVFFHQIAQQLTDASGPDVESNREERSVITGGVNGYLHFSSVDSLVFAPRVSDVRFQESDSSDSQRATMNVTWDHRLSNVSSLDLALGYDDVKFDEKEGEEENDYTAPSAMLSFHTKLSRLAYQIGAGVKRIERDFGEDVTGSSVTAAIDYEGDGGQSWGASFVRQLTDTSIGLSGMELELTNFSSNDSNAETFDIIQENKIDVRWQDRLSTSSQVSLGAGYQKQDYKSTPRDQNLSYVRGGFQYALNTRWSLGVDASWERTKFLESPDLEYDTSRLYLSATYKPTRSLDVRASIGQDKRDADPSSASYTDNVALIGMRYRFF